MEKYLKCIIKHNFKEGDFGTMKIDKDARPVSLEELATYYFWPLDMEFIFWQMCYHVSSFKVQYEAQRKPDGMEITAKITDVNGCWIEIHTMSEGECKQQGYIEMNMEQWCKTHQIQTH
ncbi:MAG: hypothetical protein K6F94_07315 [Bacteroidaceae bacterium]|nr:hypothetical protein [Bacteroidaceae bacterium]